MNKKKVLQTLAVIVIPGGIPVYLGYQIYKYVKRKKDGQYQGEDPDEHQGGSEKLP